MDAGVIRGTIRPAGGWSRRRGWCAKRAPTSRLFSACPEPYIVRVPGSVFRGVKIALRKLPPGVWMEYGVWTPQKSREVGARNAHQPRRRDHPPCGRMVPRITPVWPGMAAFRSALKLTPRLCRGALAPPSLSPCWFRPWTLVARFVRRPIRTFVRIGWRKPPNVSEVQRKPPFAFCVSCGSRTTR